jgi:hypothetical protein
MPGRLIFSTTPSASGTPTERMRLDSSGRLGIGTSSPSGPLHVANATAGAQNLVRFQNTANGTDFRVASPAGASQFFATAEAGDSVLRAETNNLAICTADGTKNILFGSSAAQRMCILGTGNVGIGTASPATTLDVNGDVTITDKIIHSGDTNTAIRFPAADTVSVETGGSERARIDSSGRLGIGTSSPNTKLHIVDGEFTVSAGGNVVDAGGVINFGITTLSTYSPMATVQGLLVNSVGSELQGGLGFFTRPSGIAGQSLQRRMTITNGGLVGIGTTTPQSKFHVNTGTNQNIYFGSSGTVARITTANDANSALVQLDTQGSELSFTTGASERARIDSSGRLLVGTSTAGAQFHFQRTGATNCDLLLQGESGINYIVQSKFSTDTAGSDHQFRKYRGTIASPSIVVDGDRIGAKSFFGYDGANIIEAARIAAFVDGTPGANDMPGRLVFSVTADGASSPTEALRISNNRAITVSDGGNVVLGTTTGTKIGTATTQKIGFYNATPVVQPTAVADATDAASVITQLNALLTRMRNLGLIAT